MSIKTIGKLAANVIIILVAILIIVEATAITRAYNYEKKNLGRTPETKVVKAYDAGLWFLGFAIGFLIFEAIGIPRNISNLASKGGSFSSKLGGFSSKINNLILSGLILSTSIVLLGIGIYNSMKYDKIAKLPASQVEREAAVAEGVSMATIGFGCGFIFANIYQTVISFIAKEGSRAELIAGCISLIFYSIMLLACCAIGLWMHYHAKYRYKPSYVTSIIFCILSCIGVVAGIALMVVQFI